MKLILKTLESERQMGVRHASSGKWIVTLIQDEMQDLLRFEIKHIGIPEVWHTIFWDEIRD